MRIKLPSNYRMYGDGGYKYPWTLDEMKFGILSFFNDFGKMPSYIGMNPKDIIQMGKIKYKSTNDYLRGVNIKGADILVVPVKTCLRGTISLYL